jgi:hypothetical protein
LKSQIFVVISLIFVVGLIISISTVSGATTDKIKTLKDTTYTSKIKVIDNKTKYYDESIDKKTVTYDTVPLYKDIDGKWKPLLSGSPAQYLYVDVTAIDDGSKIIYGNATVSISNGDISKNCVLWSTDDYINETILSSSFPCYGVQTTDFVVKAKDMITIKTIDGTDYFVMQLRELANSTNIFSVIPDSSKIAVEFNIPRYFAELDGNNNVINVIVAEPDFILNYKNGKWVETWNIDDNPRKRYASVGTFYNVTSDMFVDIKPFNSWILNQTDGSWYAPIPMPKDGTKYYWDEQIFDWVKLK